MNDSEDTANNSTLLTDEKENYGFKKGNAGPIIPEIQEFERRFWAIIKHSSNIENALNHFLHVC